MRVCAHLVRKGLNAFDGVALLSFVCAYCPLLSALSMCLTAFVICGCDLLASS